MFALLDSKCVYVGDGCLYRVGGVLRFMLGEKVIKEKNVSSP